MDQQKKTHNFMESAAMRKMFEIAGKLYTDTPQLFEKVKDQSYLLKHATNKECSYQLPPIPGQPVEKVGVNDKTPKYVLDEYEELHKEFEEELKLSASLKQQKQNRLKNYILKEQEYREKIEEYSKKIKPAEDMKSREPIIESIEQDNREILRRISSIQIKTSHVLIEQENDIIMFYNEKINELSRQFKEENTRQKERHSSFKKKEEKLMNELEWIKKIAHKIDVENYYLMKRFTELKVEFETQKNDRVMLLTEDAYQKRRTEDLENKLSEHKSLLQRLMQDRDLGEDIDFDNLANPVYLESLKKALEKEAAREEKAGKQAPSQAHSFAG